MNKQTEALHKALKVLNCLNNNRVYETAWVKGAINACKEALEDISKMETTSQQAQEPVAWMLEYRDDEFDYWHKHCDEDKLALEMWFDAIRYDTTEHKIYPLYTRPAPSWQTYEDLVKDYYQLREEKPNE